MSERRVEALEERYTHLEKLMGELSEVLWRQQRELDLLRESVRAFQARLEAEPGLVEASRVDLPPHY